MTSEAARRMAWTTEQMKWIQAAHETCARYEEKGFCGECAWIAFAARAVRAERERCVKIAEAGIGEEAQYTSADWDRALNVRTWATQAKIAAALRQEPRP